MQVVEFVYSTYDNVSKILFKRGSLAFDFTNATRFVLNIGASTIDTNVTPAAITTTAILGELQFALGTLNLPIVNSPATLIVYDSLHPNGQILVCKDDKQLVFKVKTC